MEKSAVKRTSTLGRIRFDSPLHPFFDFATLVGKRVGTLNTLKQFTFGFCVLLASLVHARDLNYADMEVIFRASKTPVAEKILGTWVGRCIHYADPYRLWPAFFRFKRLSGTKGFTEYSQSHTWFNEQTDKYDHYSLKDVAEDAQCKKWIENEQWRSVFYEEGSLVNTYQYPGYLVRRETRLYQDGIHQHIVVAYSRGDKPADYPASYCFFNTKID